ncbi:MAG: hypothetical protein K6E33_06025 [Lachnospiraceae bacterium]|nr:hypothetical protein [Lachnospiraceae bacterium]
MYEQSAGWNEYYRELEPKRRKELFEKLISEDEDDGANEFRKRLFETRYTDPKNPGQEVDRFLWQCVNFIFLFKTMRIFVKSTKKEVLKAAKELCIEDAAPFGDAGTKALYWEFRNTLKRYFMTCESSSYRRKMFGLMSASDEEKTWQKCLDAWQMSRGVSLKFGVSEELALWNEAVRDEYSCQDPEALARYESYDREQTV